MYQICSNCGPVAKRSRPGVHLFYVGLLKESVVAESNLFRKTTRPRACSIVKCTSFKFVQLMALGPNGSALLVTCFILIYSKKILAFFVCSRDLMVGI